MMPILENARHEKFVQCLITGMSQRKAYKEAFEKSNSWKDETVDKRASELYKTGDILGRYRELQERLQDDAILTSKARMVCLSGMVESEGTTTSDKIRAIDTLNKMDGIYTNKLEVQGSVGLTAAEKEKLVDDYVGSLLKDD